MEVEYPTKNDLIILKRVRWSPLILAILGGVFWVLGGIVRLVMNVPDSIGSLLQAVANSIWGVLIACFIWTTWHLGRQLEKSADAGKHLREVVDDE